jgi:hypothetical protein
MEFRAKLQDVGSYYIFIICYSILLRNWLYIKHMYISEKV